MGAKVSLDFKGGDLLQRRLKKMNASLNTAKGVTVGFLGDKTYPSTHGTRGTPRSPVNVAQVAFWDEFGTNGKHPIPARPYFRTMIEEKSPEWGAAVAYLCKVHKYDARKIFTNMGIGIQAQLVSSIRGWTSPPNAPATVAIKGFNNPLVDEGIMQRSVRYLVTNKL